MLSQCHLSRCPSCTARPSRAVSLPPSCLFNALGNFSIYIQITAAPWELKAAIHCLLLPVTSVLPAWEGSAGAGELCWDLLVSPVPGAG